MAKKVSKKKSNFLEEYEHYLIPSIIAALVTVIFSSSVILAATVFIAVWVGNWIGYSLKNK